MQHTINNELTENGELFTVIDDEGYPINDGHFLSKNDAQYVKTAMDSGRFWADNVSNLCRSMDSWVGR